jgi:hypothetical protein
MKSGWKRFRYRTSRTWLRSPIVWLRHRGLDRNDVFLAEYPRSGSTWLRFMLLEIITGHSAGFLNVNRSIPEIGTHGQALDVLPGWGRLIKTHEPYRHDYHHTVYLVRDVRDVMFSMRSFAEEFGWADYFSNGHDLDGYIHSFLVGNTTQLGTWQDHVHSFLDSPIARSGEMLLVRYEELRQDTEHTLVRILNFLGLDADCNVIRAAIANNSLERMRAKEDNARQLATKLTKSMLVKGYKNGHFVGKGAVGAWRERLTLSQLAMFDHYAGEAMLRLSYPLSSSPIDVQSEGLTSGRIN